MSTSSDSRGHDNVLQCVTRTRAAVPQCAARILASAQRRERPAPGGAANRKTTSSPGRVDAKRGASAVARIPGSGAAYPAKDGAGAILMEM